MRDRERSIERGLVILTVVALLAAGCSSGGTTTSNTGTGAGAGAKGGFLRIGTTGQIDSLNPVVAFNEDPYIIFQYIYPQLVQYDTRTLSPAPDLATSWDHNADYTQWTFHLVAGAKWSDGQPLTSDDVVWTLNTEKKFENGPMSGLATYVRYMTSATAPDATTVVVDFSKPQVPWVTDQDQSFIFPKHVWEKYATGDGKALRQFPNTPQNGNPVVSGGPFMLTEYKQDQIARFAVNPNWYGPKPSIDGWGLQYFATDDAVVQALKTNAIDVIWEAVPTTAVATLRSAGMVVSATPGLIFRDLIFNSNPQKTQNLELLDPKVREAIAHAIDRSAIVQTAWNGYGSPGYSIVPPASGIDAATGKPWTDPSLQPESFDPALANQMLDDAGYKMGADGYRTANGHEMKYTVLFPHAEVGSGTRAFAIIQQDLKQIGIGVTAKVLNDNAAWQATIADHYRQFDMEMWDWFSNPDPGFILSVLRCDQWNTWNDTGYCSKAYDALDNQEMTAKTPEERLQAIYSQQQMIYNERPYIVLNYNDNLVAWNKGWTGFVPSPLGEFNPLSKQTLLGAHQT